jgi:hypothetical protein
MTRGRLATATDLPQATLDAALLDLELAGLIRRTTAGVQAISLPGQVAPSPPSNDSGTPDAMPPAPDQEPRGPPGASPTAEVLECGGSAGDDDGDD